MSCIIGFFQGDEGISTYKVALDYLKPLLKKNKKILLINVGLDVRQGPVEQSYSVENIKELDNHFVEREGFWEIPGFQRISTMELVNVEKIENIIEEVNDKFDYVIIVGSTIPFNPISKRLINKSEETYLVTGQLIENSINTRETLEFLRKRNINIEGIIVTKRDICPPLLRENEISKLLKYEVLSLRRIQERRGFWKKKKTTKKKKLFTVYVKPLKKILIETGQLLMKRLRTEIFNEKREQ